MHHKARMEDYLRRLAVVSVDVSGGQLLLGDNRKRKRMEESHSEEEDEEVSFRDDPVKKSIYLESLTGEEEEEEQEEEETEEESEEEEVDGDDKDSIFDDPDFQHMSDSDGDDLPLFDKDDSDDDEDRDSEDEEEEERKAAERDARRAEVESKAEDYMKDALKQMKGKQATAKAEVEDDFFKLDEMENFLQKEDAAEERRRLREDKGMDDDNDDEEADGIDYFGGDDLEEAEFDERAQYKDYFEGGAAKSKALMSQDTDETEDRVSTPGTNSDLLGGGSDEDDDKDLGEVKSTFEETQLRLKKRIKHLEDQAVEEKPWQMQGEIAGPARPENSLLQEHLDYDNVAKRAPAMTEEVSNTLESIILRRIKDKAWDDVERKVKPVEDPHEYKKRLVLDQEKSKLSLAQVYEQEYLQQQGQLEEGKKVQSLLDAEKEEAATKEVASIKKDMKALFAKLDTLTHFHYTPKNLEAEIKVVKNLPSIAMEEVAPVSASDATLLAPQEVQQAARGDEIGREERSETDKKRERRKKKLQQRAKHKEQERRERAVEKENPGLGNKYSKEKMLKRLEQAEKSGHVTKLKDEGKGVKSSTAFFSRLQQETQDTGKQKKGKKGQEKKKVHAANLKL